MAALTGKGRKTRHVPLDGGTVTLLTAYLEEHRLDQPGRDDHPVFFNQHRARLSRGGITWIIRKYQDQIPDPLLAGVTISPHILRHSKAMHLYEAGVPLPYIRDILGHVELSTTEIYARASTEAKRKALEAAYQDIVTSDLPEWNQDARPPRLAHQPLTVRKLCAVPARRTGSDQAGQIGAAHNPALRIGSPISPCWLTCSCTTHRHVDGPEFPGFPFERYTNNIVAHCDTKDQARELRAAIAKRLGTWVLSCTP